MWQWAYNQSMVDFNKRSTAEQVSEGVDLSAHTVIITGANTGIGWETARVLALRGADVVLACRNRERAAAARDRIIEYGIPGQRLELGDLDLSSLQSIRQFAKDFVASGRSLQLLINNAGVMLPTRRATRDGFEAHFGINHLGHFLLTDLLQEPLRAARGARVVCLSSSAMQFATLTPEFGDLNWKERKFSAFRAYGDSKLMNDMFAVEFTRRFASEGIVANALHPGIIASTELARDQPWYMKILGLLMLPVSKDVPRGAATSVLLATAPEYATRGALYLGDCAEWGHMPLACDADACARLWERSEELTGLR